MVSNERRTLPSHIPQLAKIAWISVTLATWGLLYLPNLRGVPGWYGDETVAVDIANNLRQGEYAYGPLQNTFLSIVYQPVYEWMLASGLSFFGGDIIGARLVNALFAAAIALIVLLAGWRTLGPTTAPTAALLFLGAEQTLVHFRMAFPHNGIALGLVISLFAATLRPAWRSDSAIGIGNLIAVGSHPLGVYSAISASLRRLFYPRSWALVAVLPVILLCLFYIPVVQRFGIEVWQDCLQIGASYASYRSENQTRLWLNIWSFFSFDAFHFLGAIGILLILARQRRTSLWPFPLTFLVYCYVLFSNRSNLTVFYYQAVVFLPLLSIGIAVILAIPCKYAAKIAPSRRKWARAIPALAALMIALSSIPKVWTSTLRPRNQPWVTQSTVEVETAAAWINERTKWDDVVIANSNIWWLLRSNKANLLQLTAWDGYATFMHEFGTPKSRFRTRLDPDVIRFIVIGDIDQVWTLAQPHVIDSLKARGIEKWPIVWQSCHYLILENPSRLPVKSAPTETQASGAQPAS